MLHALYCFLEQAFTRLVLHIMHGGAPKDIAFPPSLITRALELYPPNSQLCSDFSATYLYALHRLNKTVQWG
jgi:hypothetical protein